MKKNVKAIVFALSVGVGLSGVFSTNLFARPDSYSCDQLQSQCSQGNQGSCETYQLLCRQCEIAPDTCIPFCEKYPDHSSC